MEMGTLVIDIDGTICTQDGTNYSLAKPKYDVIEKINKKYDEGYLIILFTARGTKTGFDWSNTTRKQLADWDVKYHTLQFGKPPGDLYIDDKAVNINDWEVPIESEAVINKIWGKEYLLAKTDKYAFKRLEIDKDKCISKQYHKEKHETWHIAAGTGLMNIEGSIEEVGPGRTVIIPPNTIHQIMATSDKLVILEASTTELSDVVRLQRSFDFNE